MNKYQVTSYDYVENTDGNNAYKPAISEIVEADEFLIGDGTFIFVNLNKDTPTNEYIACYVQNRVYVKKLDND